MKKVIEWLKKSNRWKHLVGGFILGAGAPEACCAVYAGLGVASALEFKDWQAGGKWDWIDLGITLVGVVLGFIAKEVVWTACSR